MFATLLIGALSVALVVFGFTVPRFAQVFDEGNYASLAAPPDTIATGTRITLSNWQQYKRFISFGLQVLFSGKYFWEIPREAVMEVAPTRQSVSRKSSMKTPRSTAGSASSAQVLRPVAMDCDVSAGGYS